MKVRDLYETTSLNDQKLKAFLLDKWKERAASLGHEVPTDLSGACKFTALFAQKLFGGEIRANEYHTWVNKGGRVIDLAGDSEDAKSLKRGEVPPSGKFYYAETGTPLPDDVYEEDEYFMEEDDFLEAIDSCRPRVDDWLREWKSLNAQ